MPTYKTPDVYVEEISIFPPSVAEVESAVPCFIGYTEKATEITDNDLNLKAKKINSLVEYEQYFGGAPSYDGIKVTLESGTNNVTGVELDNKFYLYDSLRMFFDQGGGKCYIISAGLYKKADGTDNTMEVGNFEDAIDVLKKVDEPTIIAFPDATLLDKNELYKLQQKALTQCGKLGDRVALCDLKNVDDATNFDHDDAVDEFRTRIGINNLKYGAAYTPWLKTALPKDVSYYDITPQRADETVIDWKSLTTDRDIIQLFKNLDAVKDTYYAAVTTEIVDKVTGTTGQTVQEYYEGILDTNQTQLLSETTLTDAKAELKAIYEAVHKVFDKYQTYKETLTAVTPDDTLSVQAFDMFTEMETIEDSSDFSSAYQDLYFHSVAYTFDEDAAATANSIIAAGSNGDDLADDYGVTKAQDWATSKPPVDTDYDAVAKIYTDIDADGDLSATEKVTKKLKQLLKIANETFDKVNSGVTALYNALSEYMDKYEERLEDSFSLYQTILGEIEDTLVELPPSGAIAGVYAYVDETRGVHKAPANVSISSVDGLTHDIDNEEQEDLNVDVNAGKSVNAIRAFTGKGILVWGARTLAGNSNEWRYVSVRRFFNMVEESIKKSTFWAVFEPNDSNTWVRVKAMIDNYLTDKWKDGALAGATPEEAFFVKIGLGLTMTAQDINEGKMIVEIGMAVVRPAEFIILKFSHKMQTS